MVSHLVTPSQFKSLTARRDLKAVSAASLLCLSLLVAPLDARSQTAASSSALPRSEKSKSEEPQARSTSIADVQGMMEKAKQMVFNGDDDAAREMLLQKLAELEKQGATSSDLNLMVSIMYAARHNYDEAIKYLRKVQSTGYETEVQSVREGALVTCRIGDCLYRQGKLKEALSEYYIAVLQAKPLKESDAAKKHILENTVGCLIALRKYKEAQPLAEELVAVSKACAQDNMPWHLADYLWSALRLSDVYEFTGEKTKESENSERIYHLMMKLTNLRSQLEKLGRLPSIEEIKQISTAEYVKDNSPETIGEEWWLSFENTFKTLPVVTWEDPNVKPWAVLICIHGLGLENRAFTFFGQRMAKRGVQTCALDVRGFGAWQEEYGSERVAFDKCLADIRRMVRALRKHRELPVFVLGESMGGAIALRAAAELGGSINGVISSVPSAERFQERKMSAKVAFHFLKGANKPFDIGSQVAEQASSDDVFKSRWENDPKAKMDMTPKELINFAVFMRRTKAHAAKIDDVPVMIVQGLKDRLVKPKGSFELFEAIPEGDKNLLLLGTREHLIFENAEHPESLLNSVCDWMKEHAAKPVSESTDTSSVEGSHRKTSKHKSSHGTSLNSTTKPSLDSKSRESQGLKTKDTSVDLSPR